MTRILHDNEVNADPSQLTRVWQGDETFALIPEKCGGSYDWIKVALQKLVHGMAHVLEHPLRAAQREENWHHARLCAILLLPVMQFNRRNSDKWKCLCTKWPLDSEAIFAVLRQFFDQRAYQRIVPLLSQRWMQVLRDPCSCVNSALVRPGDSEYFRTWKTS
ncbi:MAG: hypothetical protein ABSG68_01110 [Thermoguttaceae bacterium]|jgi:hypothetical protein